MVKFLSLISSAALSIALSLWTLGHTLGDAPYLEHKADQAKVYELLSKQLPEVDSTVIQGQVHTLLPQLIDHLLKGSPAPVADLGSGPVTLGQADPQLLRITQTLPAALLYAGITCSALFVIIFVLARNRRLDAFSRATFGAALGLAVTAGIFWLAPGVILNLLNGPETAPIKTVLSPFILMVMRDISAQFAILAGALLAVSSIIKVTQGASRLKLHFSKKAKIKPKGPVPPQFGPN